jgi:hypothetical protein
MYFNSQFFPQMGGMMAGHPGMQGSMHSMNMLYMESLNRQDQCSSGTGHAGLHAQHDYALHGLPQQTGPVLLRYRACRAPCTA